MGQVKQKGMSLQLSLACLLPAAAVCYSCATDIRNDIVVRIVSTRIVTVSKATVSFRPVSRFVIVEATAVAITNNRDRKGQ